MASSREPTSLAAGLQRAQSNVPTLARSAGVKADFGPN